jgi:hypothetical protein
VSGAITPTKGDGTILRMNGVEIAEVVSIPSAGGGETGQIDVTHLRSKAKEYIPDLPDNGELQMVVNLIPTDEGQRLLWAARNAQTTNEFTITFPFSPPVVETMQGVITQFAKSATASEPLRANISVRVSGEITGFPAPGS